MAVILLSSMGVIQLMRANIGIIRVTNYKLQEKISFNEGIFAQAITSL